MAEQRMKVRDKKVQKMTKDGLVEENLTDKSSVRVSNRVGDVQMGRKQGEKEENLLPLCDTTGHKRDCPCSAGNTQGRFFQRPRG